jgi:uncharacterized membrane protein (UPF0127 family)
VSGGWLVARNTTRQTVLAERLEDGSSFWAKFMGLMGRPSLPDGTGLWLGGGNGIHMLFMRFAIDAVFLSKPSGDKNGPRKVVGVRPSLRPWIGVVWFVRHAHGVLELPVGTIERTGTRTGDEVSLGEA